MQKARGIRLVGAACAAALSAPVALANPDLAIRSGCTKCHNAELKIVGPAYKDVAAKYKGDTDALERLAAKVKAGGVGTWGKFPMPPNSAVSDENIKKIVTWILSL
jgi:cytochrome c